MSFHTSWLLDPELPFMSERAWFDICGHVSEQDIRMWSEVKSWTQSQSASAQYQSIDVL